MRASDEYLSRRIIAAGLIFEIDQVITGQGRHALLAPLMVGRGRSEQAGIVEWLRLVRAFADEDRGARAGREDGRPIVDDAPRSGVAELLPVQRNADSGSSSAAAPWSG